MPSGALSISAVCSDARRSCSICTSMLVRSSEDVLRLTVNSIPAIRSHRIGSSAPCCRGRVITRRTRWNSCAATIGVMNRICASRFPVDDVLATTSASVRTSVDGRASSSISSVVSASELHAMPLSSALPAYASSQTRRRRAMPAAVTTTVGRTRRQANDSTARITAAAAMPAIQRSSSTRGIAFASSTPTNAISDSVMMPPTCASLALTSSSASRRKIAPLPSDDRLGRDESTGSGEGIDRVRSLRPAGGWPGGLVVCAADRADGTGTACKNDWMARIIASGTPFGALRQKFTGLRRADPTPGVFSRRDFVRPT